MILLPTKRDPLLCAFALHQDKNIPLQIKVLYAILFLLEFILWVIVPHAAGLLRQRRVIQDNICILCQVDKAHFT